MPLHPAIPHTTARDTAPIFIAGRSFPFLAKSSAEVRDALSPRGSSPAISLGTEKDLAARFGGAALSRANALRTLPRQKRPLGLADIEWGKVGGARVSHGNRLFAERSPCNSI